MKYNHTNNEDSHINILHHDYQQLYITWFQCATLLHILLFLTHIKVFINHTLHVKIKIVILYIYYLNIGFILNCIHCESYVKFKSF